MSIFEKNNFKFQNVFSYYSMLLFIIYYLVVCEQLRVTVVNVRPTEHWIRHVHS